MQLGRDVEWQALTDPNPWAVSLKEFIDIFIAKSQYYGTWKPVFDKAEKIPIMRDWLALEEDRKSDRAVWGEVKSSYSFEDLKAWIQKKEREQIVAERKQENKPSEKKKTKKKTKKAKQNESE
jgi:hypothetical protein